MTEDCGRAVRKHILNYKGGVSVELLEEMMINKTKLCSRCLLVLWLFFSKKKKKKTVLKRISIRFFETMTLVP